MKHVVLICLLAGHLHGQPPSGAPDMESLSALPLAFLGNHGQMVPEVRFRATSLGGTINFFRHGLQLVLPGKDGTQVDRVFMAFDGANPQLVLDAGRPGVGTFNFLRGNDASAWVTGIKPHDSVIYRHIFPGVDLVYEGDQRRLKGTWKVRAGSSPASIGWFYRGASGLEILDNGDLKIVLEGSEFIESAPVAWQVIGGRRVPVACRFVIGADDRVCFEVGPNDTSRELVIDPTLVWGTFIGGGGTDIIQAMDIDDQGMIYLTGYIHSTTQFPLKSSRRGQPFQVCYGGEIGDAFVMKIDQRRTPPRLVYSTRLGGGRLSRCSGTDWCQSLQPTIPSLCLSEMAPALNIPSSGPSPDYAWFPQSGGGVPTGLVSSWYPYPHPAAWTAVPPFDALKARGLDRGLGIAVDNNTYEVVVVGKTNSDDFPGTGSLSQPNLAVSHNLPGAPASSYPGNQIDCYPAFQPNLGSNYQGQCEPPSKDDLKDAFIARLSKDGTRLVFGSYFGGVLEDEAQSVRIDDAGNAFVVGWSMTDPALDITAYDGAQTVPGGLLDAFVLKVGPQGLLLGATYLGGTGFDGAIDVDIGPLDETPGSPSRVYVLGTTQAIGQFNNLRQAVNSQYKYVLQPNYGGHITGIHSVVNDGRTFLGDMFLARLTTDLTACEYLTYLDPAWVTSGGVSGAVSDDWASALRVDDDGDVYVTGVVSVTPNQGLGAIFRLRLTEPGWNSLIGYTSHAGEAVIWPYDIDINDNLVAITGEVVTLPWLQMPVAQPIQGWFTRDDVCTNGQTIPRFYDGAVSSPELNSGGSDAFVAAFDKATLSLQFSTYVGGEAIHGSACATGCGQPLSPTSTEVLHCLRFDGDSLICGGRAGKNISTAPRINPLNETNLWYGSPPGSPCTAGPWTYTFNPTYYGGTYSCGGSADMYLIKIQL